MNTHSQFAKKWLYLRARRYLIHPLCRTLYRDNDRDINKCIIVAGAARSGTTWLANIIASQLPSRLMFEPFHSKMVPGFRDFAYFYYMRPQESNDRLLAYCQQVLTGSIRHHWIDRQVTQIFPNYRIVKDIRANLFLKWMHDRFPTIPILFIIRHPCAVVLSRMQLGWATDPDIEPLLHQTDLVQDFMMENIDLILRATSAESKHAIIWCINNLVPLSQFGPGKLNVVFYENLILNPAVEIERVFSGIRHTYDESVFQHLKRPSGTTTNSSAIMAGRNAVGRWKEDLSRAQIDEILSTVESFGLGRIYDDSVVPLVSTL